MTDEQVLTTILYAATHGWNVIDTGEQQAPSTRHIQAATGQILLTAWIGCCRPSSIVLAYAWHPGCGGWCAAALLKIVWVHAGEALTRTGLTLGSVQQLDVLLASVRSPFTDAMPLLSQVEV